MSAPSSTAYGFAGFELKPQERAVIQAGTPVKLGARAFDVLMALIERRDRPVTKDELFDLVWPGLVVEENNLQVQVSTLRKLFGPNVIATIPGRGYQFVCSVQTAAGRAAPSRTTPNNLPQQRTHFIGRAAELAQCTRLLGETRLLTLTGIGGCGKTRLALQLAQQWLDRFPDGVWFVDLAPVQEAERIAVPLAEVIGVRERTGTPLVGRIAEQLAAQRGVIVLDNCEHVVDAVAALAETLLARCAELKFIVTSREVLGLAGEQIFAVRPLSLPATDDLDTMNASEAVRLFVDRARLAIPDLVLDEQNAAVIADICRRLDGIALAIELAAARAAMLSFDEISARLDDRFRLLTGGSRALPRQQTLQATMQWSYDLLSPAEQRMLRQLAVFAGGWTLAAAARIADVADEYEVLELLTRLHDKSLVQVDRDAAGQPRYRMLETVRQYAQERLNDAGESDQARTRHLTFYLELAERADREFEEQPQSWQSRLDLERENLLSAHEWCECDVNGATQGLRLIRALKQYWFNRGLLSLGLRVATEALSRPGAQVRDVSRSVALGVAGQYGYFMGRYEGAHGYLEESLAIAREIGDKVRIAAALNMIASVSQARGDPASARRHCEEALSVSRASGYEHQVAWALASLGDLCRAEGDLDAAEPLLEESLAICRRLGDRPNIAQSLLNFARISIDRRQFDRARGMLRLGHRTAVEAGSKPLERSALDVSAGLLVFVGDLENAVALYYAAQKELEQMGIQREPADEAFLTPLIAKARAAMDAADFATAQVAGRALSYDDAIAKMREWLERGS